MKLNSIIIIVLIVAGLYLIKRKPNEPFKTDDITLLPIVGGDGSKANPWTYHIVNENNNTIINENKPSDVNIKTWIGKTIKPFLSKPLTENNNNFKIAFPENHTIHITRKLKDGKIVVDNIEGVKDNKIKSINSVQIENLISFVVF